MDKSDRRRIFIKLDEMIKYVEELNEILPGNEEYSKDLIKRRACEKTIEIAIESLIDVSAMIISSEKFGLPSSEEGIFDILVDRNILSKEISEKLKDMKGFRNVLIHRYAHIDDEIVYHNLSNYLDDFYMFKKAIELFLENKNI